MVKSYENIVQLLIIETNIQTAKTESENNTVLGLNFV